MERVWCVCGLRGSNNVALGYDEGSIIIKVSRSNLDAKETYLEVVQEKPWMWKISFRLLSIFLLFVPVFCIGGTGGAGHVYGHQWKDHLG